jgi:uncharacterized membrane protein YeiH
MDLFGVLVLSVATGLGGGFMRDIILGRTTPTVLSDWRFLVAAALAGLLVFLDYPQIVHWNRFIIAFDAAGLAIFTVTGTTIALADGLGPVSAVLLGMLTGVGGGVLRDILAAEVPLVLRTEVYAVASLLGATIIIIANEAQVQGSVTEIVAAITIFAVRMVSVWKGWKIPIARSEQSGAKRRVRGHSERMENGSIKSVF